MKRDRVNLVLATLLLSGTCMVGCDDTPTADAGLDAGRDAGGDTRDAAVLCARNADCEDTAYCTEHRCMPGHPAADARGCLEVDGPCTDTQVCDEDADQCIANDCTTPDMDGDGRASRACGGNDCDDDDANRYPGNAEMCDAEGHDEDCNPDTLAGADGDVDEDGFISALCCNGPSCGDDCNDANALDRPGAAESCDGRDNDCDGAVDEDADGTICPGGTCRAGRCDLEPWARTFGAEGEDSVAGAAMDSAGNIYIAGSFTGSADFGGREGSLSSTLDSGGQPTPDIYIVSYAADGRFRWARRFGGEGGDSAEHLALDETAGQMYVLGSSNAPFIVAGATVSGEYLIAVDLDGGDRWTSELPWARPLELEELSSAAGPVLAGRFFHRQDFGGGERGEEGGLTGFVLHLTTDGSYDWDYVTGTDLSGGEFAVSDLISTSTGSIVFTGRYRNGNGVDFGGGLRAPFDIYDSGFVVSISASGAYLWDYHLGAPAGGASIASVIEDVGTGFVLTGTYFGSVDFGDGIPTSGTSFEHSLIRLDPDGSYTSRVAWESITNQNVLSAVTTDSHGNLYVAGTFTTDINFGGGLLPSPTTPAAFLVSFDSELNHRWDEIVTRPGYPGSTCAAAYCSSSTSSHVIGPADSAILVGRFRGDIDLGTATRRSVGAHWDVFVRRSSR